MSAGQRIRLTLALLLSFTLHIAFGSSLSLFNAQPNLALLTLLVCCLFCGPRTGAFAGFFTGLLEGSYAAGYLGSFLVTRSLAGWLVGALDERLFRDNPLIAMGIAFLGTLLAECCFFLFAPQPHPARYFLNALTGSLYNAALALPLYYLLRRFLIGSADDARHH
jgi:rod shape-determining protein MreD